MTKPFEILLASDFSPRCDRPLDRALQLARDIPGRLVIAHVVEGEDDGPDMLRRIETRLRADLPDAAGEAVLTVRRGSAPEVLADIAAERGSDLVVTGVARFNSVGDYLLGTAVDHIIRCTDKPVLVVRKRPKRAYRKIIIPTDFSARSRAAVLHAADLFPGADFMVLHAYQVPYQAWLTSEETKADVRAEHRAYMDKFIADLPNAIRGRLQGVIEEGDLNGTVMRRIDAEAADLLVLGARPRESRATLSANIESLLSIADADVLVVRAR